MTARNDSNVFSMDSLEARSMMSNSPAVVGYLPDYQVAAMQNANTHKLDKVDWNSLTQLNYFSMVPNADGTLPTETSSHGTMDQLKGVVSDAHAHGVKVYIVIGGDRLDASLISIADHADTYQTFADSLQTFADTYHIDGVDLDQENAHPTEQQIANYGNLIHFVRGELSGNLKLSAAVYATQLSIATDKDPHGSNWNTFDWQLDQNAISSLDSIGVMDYDLDYSDHSPLVGSENNMTAWAGHVGAANTGKLIFGVPFYGKAGFGWGSDDENAPPQNGSETYDALVGEYLNHHSSLPVSKDSFDAAFADALSGQSCTWHFNGKQTIADKTKFALDNGFGGVMAWSLGDDRVQNTNNTTGATDSYSLLSQIGSTMRSNGFLTSPKAAIIDVPLAPTTGTGSITGTVYYDGNWDGQRDANSYDGSLETGYSGRTVFLDANGNGQLDAGELSTETGDNGNFAFNGLCPTAAITLPFNRMLVISSRPISPSA